MKPVAIVSACRTAIGGFGGSLKGFRAPQLAAIVMRAAVDRCKDLDPTILGDIRFGNCLEDHDGLNTARVGQLLAGLPVTTPAVTINRVCTSGMEATATGAVLIGAGFYDAVLVGGCEAMSNAPYVLPAARWGARMQDTKLEDSLIHALHAGSHFCKYPEDGPVEWARNKPYIMGLTAEFLAMKHSLTRQEQDEVALRSHHNAERATNEGAFASQIVPVSIPQKKGKEPKIFDKDEHFRPGITMDDLEKSAPYFIPKKGTVTALNASGVNDGASAMVLMDLATAERTGQNIMGVITDWAISGNEAELMGEGPVGAVNKLMAKTGKKSANEYDLVEINEAFAAQWDLSAAVNKLMAKTGKKSANEYLSVEKQLGLDRERCNVNGSGIGLGHPVGSTGARIIVSLVHELIRQDKKVGCATLCGGGGVAMAVEVSRA
eukprot:CAMPEP_0175894416 /NCGR_PEP_ID=MMETSP0107_2-20121207/49978_1 /TAXON_ID=195067 ORGANISM="Goniomonas pacifica, Strain CCMP1869" /NCGR_SAMPLE_ID=MMETSP0107_2 /ASSEMBLY_ACC=CAM_ASM_000203 /LENGTH=433 /DNA_ID=CAMNT_0017215503 /DNA_START=19 /DNA_END=1320 /DNA_ORIENTATION=+